MENKPIFKLVLKTTGNKTLLERSSIKEIFQALKSLKNGAYLLDEYKKINESFEFIQSYSLNSHRKPIFNN